MKGWQMGRYGTVRLPFLWLLFFTNLVLLVVNIICLLPRTPDSAFVAEASKHAATLGMDLGYATAPLTLLVDKNFPAKDRFKLFDQNQQLLVIGEDVSKDEGGVATRKALIALGTDFELACFYSLNNEIHPNELRLTRKDESLFDLNADGSYDVRVQHSVIDSSDGLPKIQIWYDSQWRGVIRGGDSSKYRKKLQDGDVVEFDIKRGQWIAPANPPSVDSNSAEFRLN